jgi:hypothetical protein
MDGNIYGLLQISVGSLKSAYKELPLAFEDYGEAYDATENTSGACGVYVLPYIQQEIPQDHGIYGKSI